METSQPAVPDPDLMRSIMRRYLELVSLHDVEGVLALFAEGVSVEDPVGGPPGTHVVGRDAVAEFFRRGFASSRPSATLTGPIRAGHGNEAAMPLRLCLDLGGVRHELDVIDVMSFDSEGRISSLRAFWDIRAARPLETDDSTSAPRDPNRLRGRRST